MQASSQQRLFSLFLKSQVRINRMNHIKHRAMRGGREISEPGFFCAVSGRRCPSLVEHSAPTVREIWESLRFYQPSAQVFYQVRRRPVAIEAEAGAGGGVHPPEKTVEDPSEMAVVAVARQAHLEILMEGDGIEVILQDVEGLRHRPGQRPHMIIGDPVPQVVGFPVHQIKPSPVPEDAIDEAPHEAMEGAEL